MPPTHQYVILSTQWVYVGFVSKANRLTRLVFDSCEATVLQAVTDKFPGIVCNDRLLPGLQRELVAYFQGKLIGFSVALDLSWASDFAREALQACLAIPLGHTITYGDLARRVGRCNAARAIGTVMAKNRIPLVIPCHRIIAADGAVGGYSSFGQSDFKKRLLAHEASILSKQAPGEA